MCMHEFFNLMTDPKWKRSTVDGVVLFRKEQPGVTTIQSLTLDEYREKARMFRYGWRPILNGC